MPKIQPPRRRRLWKSRLDVQGGAERFAAVDPLDMESVLARLESQLLVPYRPYGPGSGTSSFPGPQIPCQRMSPAPLPSLIQLFENLPEAVTTAS